MCRDTSWARARRPPGGISMGNRHRTSTCFPPPAGPPAGGKPPMPLTTCRISTYPRKGVSPRLRATTSMGAQPFSGAWPWYPARAISWGSAAARARRGGGGGSRLKQRPPKRL